LFWLPVHGAVIGLSIAAVAGSWLPWPALIALPFLVGGSFAGLTFLGHETLHGAIVRGRFLRGIIGWIGFLPFVISPTLWVAWHNRVHHGNTNRPSVDPDAYPTLKEYACSQAVRVMTDLFSPGRRRNFGLLISLMLGFTGQSAHVLVSARQRGFLSARAHRRAIAETALGVAVWSTLAFFGGPLAFVLCFALPLLVANAIVMGFIFTNHSLSPLTEENDPLTSSLSVTAPPLIEWLTLGFGFHVEHHLFPSMSARHAPQVRDVLRSRWPSQYQSLPLTRALLALHRSPRVYKTHNTLVDPATGAEWLALEGPFTARGVAARAAAPTSPPRAAP
jgi:fatty acid desaturase